MKVSVFFAVTWALNAVAGLLPPEVGIGWENGWVREWKRDVPGLEINDSKIPLPGAET